MAIFFKTRLKWNFFFKMSSHLISQVFFGKNQKKIEVGKFKNYDEEKEYFEKKKRIDPSQMHL